MSKIGTGEGAQSYGHGLYFAGNEDVAKSYRDKLSQEDSPGSMYQVKINADPERFLDWNAPPSAQSPSVQQALQSIPGWERAIGKDSGLPVGQLVNRGLLPATYDKAGPEFSKTYGGAGIPGVKYLDQGSRGVGEGSHNFVVFDDSMIQMLKKYGLAGVGAGAAGAGALGANDGQGQ